ncbi:MAG: hypothetical protein NTV01_14780 [Bacteroidia bacterium]|nr:hypothetical protein [Bacteroidia bacterium]
MATVLVSSCETGIDINSANQDVPIAYCVLNSADSFQYVRIQKTYLIDQAALEYPPDQDSMLFKGEIVISMERWSGGKVMETVRFSPTNEIPKDSGFFPYEKNILFKAKVKIVPSQIYRLYIYLGIKEKVLFAEASSLGILKVIDPIPLPQRKISLYPGTNYTCQWEPVEHAGVYQVVVRFNYKETINGITKIEYIDWPQTFTSPGSSSDYLSNEISGSRFMHIIEDNLKPVVGTVREVIGLSFQIVSGSMEMKYYIESTAPSEGALMEKPVYSNISNGIGLFCSISRIDVNALLLSPVTIDSIAYGQFTRTLGFLDHTNDRDSTNNL